MVITSVMEEARVRQKRGTSVGGKIKVGLSEEVASEVQTVRGGGAPDRVAAGTKVLRQEEPCSKDREEVKRTS